MKKNNRKKPVDQKPTEPPKPFNPYEAILRASEELLRLSQKRLEETEKTSALITKLEQQQKKEIIPAQRKSQSICLNCKDRCPLYSATIRVSSFLCPNSAMRNGRDNSQPPPPYQSASGKIDMSPFYAKQILNWCNN